MEIADTNGETAIWLIFPSYTSTFIAHMLEDGFFKLSHINQKGSQHYIITLLLECFFHGQICRYISELGEVGE